MSAAALLPLVEPNTRDTIARAAGQLFNLDERSSLRLRLALWLDEEFATDTSLQEL